MLWNRGFSDAASRAGAAQHQIRAALHTEHSFAYFREGNRERVNFHSLSWADLDKTGFIMAGSPDSVARRLKHQMRQVGAAHFMGMFHLGNLAHHQVVLSLDWFHREVIPRLSAGNDPGRFEGISHEVTFRMFRSPVNSKSCQKDHLFPIFIILILASTVEI